MNKFKIYIEKHPDVFSIFLLAILCGIFLFWGLNFYPLIAIARIPFARKPSPANVQNPHQQNFL